MLRRAAVSRGGREGGEGEELRDNHYKEMERGGAAGGGGGIGGGAGGGIGK